MIDLRPLNAPIARLAELIPKAPHAQGCHARPDCAYTPCSCWKADN